MKRLFKHTFIRFALVGGIGFLVDLASMLLLSIWLPHIAARALAFWVAATSNWWWNRTMTFRHTTSPNNKKAAALQWMQFIGGSLIAFIPNWGCYLALMAQPLLFGFHIGAIVAIYGDGTRRVNRHDTELSFVALLGLFPSQTRHVNASVYTKKNTQGHYLRRLAMLSKTAF
ncbi:GtrA family protein [Marinomonas pontica]|uniref:GtrA family protein n=1 Tax=Marinomonas pontica TaxID=264739 RepID=UPI002243D97E|nr:GtrA family protein [Marinomonas pontica]MCW8357508.1 GtrA family protein [Marinomonas pontica]